LPITVYTHPHLEIVTTVNPIVETEKLLDKHPDLEIVSTVSPIVEIEKILPEQPDTGEVLTLAQFIETEKIYKQIGKTNGRILECIALNVTSREIENNIFDAFVLRLRQNTPSTPLSLSITFYIILNTSNLLNRVNKWIPGLNRIFKNVEIISLDLSPIDDMYIQNPNKQYTCGKYGFISGPYLMFSNTMRICRQYNTTLLVETDCHFSTNWIEKLYNYTSHSGGFWISGATYDGHMSLWENRSLCDHLNGVALYATGSSDFKTFLRMFDVFFIDYVRNVNKVAGYDYCIRLMIDYYQKNVPHEYYWKFAERNMDRTNLIINCSTPCDSFMKGTITNLYDYAILHIKS
jgi:hypothetical protein